MHLKLVGITQNLQNKLECMWSKLMAFFFLLWCLLAEICRGPRQELEWVQQHQRNVQRSLQRKDLKLWFYCFKFSRSKCKVIYELFGLRKNTFRQSEEQPMIRRYLEYLPKLYKLIQFHFISGCLLTWWGCEWGTASWPPTIFPSNFLKIGPSLRSWFGTKRVPG